MTAAIDTGTNEVLASSHAGVGTITLNRPERRNALTAAMIDGIGRSLESLDADDGVGCIVITGAGSAFCAGGDLQELEARSKAVDASGPDEGIVAQQLQDQRTTVGRIYASSKPVVASLPGAAAGAGLGLALAADFRVGCEDSLMVTAFASVALSGDYGVTWLLHQLVGPATTRELLFLSPRVDAADCQRLGLLDRLCDRADLADCTDELARRLAGTPRSAIALMKQNLREVPHLTLDESMEREVVRHNGCRSTPEHREAVAARRRRP